jgi:hypothetical protein
MDPAGIRANGSREGVVIDRLAEYVASLPQDHANAMLPQDMALCRIWYDALAPDSPARETCAALPERVDVWRSGVQRPDEATEGRRHQPLLRALTDRLQKERGHDLHEEEAAFLLAVCRLLQDSAAGGLYGRLLDLLSPHVHVLENRGAAHPLTAGLPHLSGIMHYATEEDLRGAPFRETRLLAGIEMPARGPVLSSPANLRILGDVPDNCTVVVEGECSCFVDGYVLGRVLSKYDCEVRGNIAGVTIVLYGDVRARAIINNARVVAKMNAVYCRNAQGPKLIFAGREINITEGTMLGLFITRVMNVNDDVRGGQIQVSEQVEAGYFRHLGPQQLGIVLRRELCCEDFGEVTGQELNRLLSEAYRLRRLAHNLRTMAEIADREAEHLAQSTLMYLFGGGETHKKLEEISSARRRFNTVARLISSLEGIIEGAQDGLMRTTVTFDGSAELPDLRLEAEVTGGPVDQDLQQENEEAKALEKRLCNRKLNPYQTRQLLSEAREKLSHLQEEQARIQKEIGQKEKEMHALPQYEKLLAKSGKSATKLELLQKLLPGLRDQPEKSPIISRLNSGFVTMTLRSIERQTRFARKNRARSEKHRKDFRSISERLGRDFQIRVLENPEDESQSARARGRFEAGVRIYMDMFVENNGGTADESVIITHAEDKMTTYIRTREGRGYHMREEQPA